MKSIHEHMWLAHPSSGGCTKYALEGAYSMWYSGTNIPSSIVHPSTLVSLTKHVVILLFSVCPVSLHFKMHCYPKLQGLGRAPILWSKTKIIALFHIWSKSCRLTLY